MEQLKLNERCVSRVLAIVFAVPLSGKNNATILIQIIYSEIFQNDPTIINF